jgi:fructose-bisphosphate aldolase/2-amino-3,7-dideoxy-D-threo-hept-6-ulosonate synthase
MEKYMKIEKKTRSLGAKGKGGSPRYVIMPIDHLFSNGPMDGLETVEDIKCLLNVTKDSLTSVIAHIGTVRDFSSYMDTTSQIVHLSGQTSMYEQKGFGALDKTLVTSVDEAKEVGADAVSVHINWGSSYEDKMLSDLREVKSGCLKYELPLLIMSYPRWMGCTKQDEYDVNNVARAVVAAHAAGANIIKCPYTGDVDSFRKVTRAVPVPVVIAGGPRKETVEDVLTTVREAMDAGAAGVSLGRNIFQANHPEDMARALYGIIVNDINVEESLKIAKGRRG